MVRILILGCGWVGESFADLAMKRGAEVIATVTTQEKAERLREKGIHAIVHNFDLPADNPLDIQQVDYVLNSIPASKKSTRQAVEQRFNAVSKVLNRLSYERHIYLSSIGIYPERDDHFDEGCPDEALHSTLFAAEIAMTACAGTTVYRLGGLFGKSRIFAKYFAGREYLAGGEPANFIHVDDVVELIWQGFVQSLQQPIYNIVCPVHPSKEDVIRASAEKYGFDLPVNYLNGSREPSHAAKQKVVSGALIINELNFQPIYRNPVDF